MLKTGEKLTFTTKSHLDSKMCRICELKETLWNCLLDFLPSYLDLWGSRRSPKHFPDIPGRYRVVGTLVLKRERSGLLFLGMAGMESQSSPFRVGPVGCSLTLPGPTSSFSSVTWFQGIPSPHKSCVSLPKAESSLPI